MKKPRRGRPPLGDRARSIPVVVKLSPREHAAIVAAVAAENERKAWAATTVSSWIRDHALDPLGLADFEPRSGDE